MAKQDGIHLKINDTAFIFGEIVSITSGSGDYKDAVANVKLKSKYYDSSKMSDVYVVHNIAFWDEPEKILENGKQIRAKSLATQIKKSKAGDRLLVKCYMHDEKFKAQAIGYPRSCFPYMSNNKEHNLVYGKVFNCKKGNDGRQRFTISTNALVEGQYMDIYLNITVNNTESFNNLAHRADRCIKNGVFALCNVSDIKANSFMGKDGQIKVNYSTWLSSFEIA